MDVQAILTLAVAVLALSLKPGPGMMMMASKTLSEGMQACWVFLGGMSVTYLGYLIVIFAGYQFLEDDLLFVTLLVKALAAAYLIWIGIKGLQSEEFEITSPEASSERAFDGFTAAMILTASNPLVILFYAGILPTLVQIPGASMTEMIIVIGVVLGVEWGVALAYCAPLAATRRLFTPAMLRRVNIVSCSVIIVLGLVIGYSALPAQDLLAVRDSFCKN